ncbi:hypothetical protein ACPC0Q_19390 [Bacillus bombysepticus]
MYSKLLKYLFEKNNNKNITYFREQDLTLLLETKFIGISTLLEKKGYVKFSKELYDIIRKIEKINYIRNINMLNEALFTDLYFEKHQIKRIWFKGIADIYENPSLLGTWKLIDSDVMVNNIELAREMLLRNNFKHGILDSGGKWMDLGKEEIKKVEAEHYEILPLTKVIELPIMNLELNEKIMNRYWIYHNKNNTFYTNFSLDVHHSFTIGLKPLWMLKKEEIFPVMSNLDDIWYSINKTYYEVIIGDSIDLQLLFKTIMKIKQAKVSLKKIAGRLASKEFEFLNEEAIICLFKLSDQDISENQISNYLDNLKKRIEVKVSQIPPIDSK